MDELSLDERFYLLLHKKIMNKTGSAKRRAKKYYLDQYKKTGIIPAPLLLIEKGVMDGRRCSGRPRVIDEQTRRRFVEMVKASCDRSSAAFIFITRKARTLKNYHHWLEQELGKSISLPALRRCAQRENLKFYLEKEDYPDHPPQAHSFKPAPVFDLIQVDGCRFRYLKIKDENGCWQYPQVMEFFDTGSRYMFVLEPYFSESSSNAVDLFTRFLLSTGFAEKTIRIRPDNAKGFLNLKRVIHALNLEHSTPGGFYLEPDFSRAYSPKHKAHLESSHRSLHNFEIRIIKAFEDRIVKTVPGRILKHGKMEKITVTLLDITLPDLKHSAMLKAYRDEHNHSRHYFSEKGQVRAWTPANKLNEYLSSLAGTLNFTRDQVRQYMKYGFRKIRATVSKKRTIRHGNRDYDVTTGAQLFSRHKSTPVKISRCKEKLFIFEPGEDGILLGEALARQPFEQPPQPQAPQMQPDELDMMILFLESRHMIVERPVLIEVYHQGISLERAKQIFHHNQARYAAYTQKIRQPEDRKKKALFNAFILDCQKAITAKRVVTYASHGDLS